MLQALGLELRNAALIALFGGLQGPAFHWERKQGSQRIASGCFTLCHDLKAYQYAAH